MSLLPHKTLRIAFGCQARTGKSTAVSYLIDHGGGVELSFAGPLYDIMKFAQKTCDFPEEKDRTFLQYVGTEWARAKDPDVWVKALLRKADSFRNLNIFVSDVRFPNELEALKKAGFKTVRLLRDDATGDKTFGSGSRSHASETAMDTTPLSAWNYVIKNNGSLNEFYRQLDDLVKDIHTPPWDIPSAWKQRSDDIRELGLVSQETEEQELARLPVLGGGKTSSEYLDETAATENEHDPDPDDSWHNGC